MKVRALEEPFSDNETSEIVHLEFDVDSLMVTVLFDGYKVDVSFDSPAGFRVLDEGDLLEFWPKCSLPNGWLFEIESQGWLDQETRRDGFVSAQHPEIKEYFVVGVNYCVNVLAWEAPSVVESVR